MADLTVVSPLVYGTPNSGVAPVSASAAPGGDRFAATQGRKYLLRVANTDASPHDVEVDDPTSGTGVPGALAAQDPDVNINVPNATQRALLVDGDRFRDSNGWVNLSYPNGVTGMTLEVYGPL